MLAYQSKTKITKVTFKVTFSVTNKNEKMLIVENSISYKTKDDPKMTRMIKKKVFPYFFRRLVILNMC